MVETIEEFGDELRVLRTEMIANGETADVKLVASWVDRLILSLEKITPTLALMAIELEQLSYMETPSALNMLAKVKRVVTRASRPSKKSTKTKKSATNKKHATKKKATQKKKPTKRKK